MVPLFFASAGGLGGDEIVLSGAEGRHAAVVRRLRPGERVDVGDGAGLVAECVVAGVAGGTGLRLAVKNRRVVPRPEPTVTVVQAIPKGDRGELAVEEMSEVGVDRDVPWAAERSVPIWRDERGVTRWRGTAREAAKQARRAWIPDVTAAAASTADVARYLGEAALAVLLDPDASRPLATLEPPAAGDLVVLVGPEGGIAPQETAAFLAAGATAYRLGPTVLRASTAGAVCAALLLSRTARWS